MKTTCPHCSQHIEIDEETLTSLQASSHFACPSCSSEVPVPALPEPPATAPLHQPRGENHAPQNPAPSTLARTHRGLNRNLLILGSVALLVLGGLAFFLASQKSGDTHVTNQNIANEIINNTYFQQLIASGATTEKDLEAVADIQPYDDGFIGISREKVTWEEAREFAAKTGADILEFQEEELADFLTSTFPEVHGTTVWIAENGNPRAADSPDVMEITTLDRKRRAFIQWPQAPASPSPVDDFRYTSDGSSITITGYNGKGGEVRIPDIIDGLTVTGIGMKAFMSRESLTSVTIPASVTEIGYFAFGGCSALLKIEVAASNPSYRSLDGVLFNADQTVLIRYPGGKAGSYTIPSSVTEIGARAIVGCDHLTNVTIPTSVTSINEGAFYACANLLDIEVTEGNTSYQSVGGVLFNVDQTKLIKYPQGKTGDCIIPAGVTNIEDNAFLGCTGLSSVIIPDSVIGIGESAFQHCTNLTHIAIGNGVTSIERSAFENCASLTKVTIPGSVSSIRGWAFRGCTALTRLVISTSVTAIGGGAFSDCAALLDIEVAAGNPKYRSVDGVLFDADQTKLILYPGGKTGNYTIPANVTKIGYMSFSGCAGLSGVTIPNSVIDIESYAFKGCTGLDDVTLPERLTMIEDEAFAGCTGLISATFKGNAPASFRMDAFKNTATGFTIYFRPGATGFTTPEWHGYPAKEGEPETTTSPSDQ